MFENLKKHLYVLFEHHEMLVELFGIIKDYLLKINNTGIL